MLAFQPAQHSGEPPEAVDEFIRLSVILTGFAEYELLGTGMVNAYYDELLRIIGAREAGALFGALSAVSDGDDERFREVILDSPRYGPVARDVLMMWYLGTWSQLPREWRNLYGATSYDTDHV